MPSSNFQFFLLSLLYNIWTFFIKVFSEASWFRIMKSLTILSFLWRCYNLWWLPPGVCELCSLLAIFVLIERTFQREGSPYLACNDRNAFFTSEKLKKYHAWSCQNVCDALTFLLDNFFIRFGTKLCRQVVGIPMGTNCAPWLQIYSCFVMRGTLWCLFLMISSLM